MMIKSYKFRGWRLACLIVMLPLAACVAYYVFFAADRYVSSAQVVVREEGSNSGAQISGLSMLLTGSSPASREETLYLREYIVSPDMMKLLESKLHWVELYSTQRRDPAYWLNKNDHQENILDYYQRMVTAHYDETTGLLKVDVEAFDPKLAEEMLRQILIASEQFVNEVSHSIAREQVKFSEGELAKARDNYKMRKDELITFQNKNKVLDGQLSAQGRANIISAMESDFSAQQAAYKEILLKLNAASPQAQQQKLKIQALGQQLAAEKKLLVSAPAGDQLNVIASTFQQLVLDAGMAEDSYKASVAALDNARIETYKKIRTLVTVVSPNTPDLAIYPERIYNLITIALALLMLYGVARFLIASIEDHRD